MTPNDDLYAVLRAKPFRPFQIHLTDGRVYEVRHPELVMVGRSSAIIGIPGGGEPPTYASYETISLLHVVRMVPMEGATAG